MHPHKQEAKACASAKMRRMGLSSGGSIPAGQPGSDKQPDGTTDPTKDVMPKASDATAPKAPEAPSIAVPDHADGGADSRKRGGRVKRKASGGSISGPENYWGTSTPGSLGRKGSDTQTPSEDEGEERPNPVQQLRHATPDKGRKFSREGNSPMGFIMDSEHPGTTTPRR